MFASSQNLGLYSMRQASLSAPHALQVCVPVFPERVKLRQRVKNGSLDFGDPPKMVYLIDGQRLEGLHLPIDLW